MSKHGKPFRRRRHDNHREPRQIPWTVIFLLLRGVWWVLVWLWHHHMDLF